LQAAINSIQAGIIDATCFGGTNQTIAAPVTWGWTTQTSGGPVPDGTGPKTIIFDSATTFTPGSSGLTMFNPGRAGYWRHLHVHLGSLNQSYSGAIVAYSNDWYGATGSPSTLKPDYDGDGLYVDDGYGNSAYTAISMKPGNYAVDFLHFNNIQNSGGAATISMDTEGSGWINSNTFTNVVDTCSSGSHVLWKIVANGIGSSGAQAQISGNIVDYVNYEASGGNRCETWDISGESPSGGDGKVLVNTNHMGHVTVWDAGNLLQFVDHITASGSTMAFRNTIDGGAVDNMSWKSWNGAGSAVTDPMGYSRLGAGNWTIAAPTLQLSGLLSSYIDLNPNLGSTYWTKLGTWSGATYQNPLVLYLATGVGAYGENSRQGLSTVVIQSGNPGGAGSGPPNLSGISVYSHGYTAVLGVQAVQTGCPGCVPDASNSSWDIYVQTPAYTNLNLLAWGDPNAAFAESGAVLSGCATLPSTCLGIPNGGFLTGNVLPILMDNSGNSFAKTLSLGSGTTSIVYRCTTSGILPAGALTSSASSCGASVDSGLRTQ
jgi:hypothetical protein